MEFLLLVSLDVFNAQTMSVVSKNQMMQYLLVHAGVLPMGKCTAIHRNLPMNMVWMMK
jgi:hypothetical protein